MLQYVCPVGILIYSCIKDKVAPTLGEIVSIILAIGGTFLIATHGQLDQLSMTPAGLFWGLFSALTYALYIILPIALIKKWGSSLVIGVGMVIAGLVALPFTGVLQANIPTSLDFLLAFAGIILIGTVFAYTAFLKGASLIGPVKSSLLASIEPISAVFFAFLIMNEQFYPIDFLGMVNDIVCCNSDFFERFTLREIKKDSFVRDREFLHSNLIIFKIKFKAFAYILTFYVFKSSTIF